MAKEFVENDSAETKARRKVMTLLAKKAFRGISNANFAKTDTAFIEACEKAEVKPTARQASKWRTKSGKAYNGR